jgi:phosphoglucomutase
VLTGFKYIGEKIKQFEEAGNYKYVFGGEESYGYLTGTYARDKDAIASTLLISECCAYLKNRGMTITDYLDSIFNEYGFYNDRNVSIDAEGLKGVEVIGDVMKKFREKAPDEIGGVKVIKVLDYVNDIIYDSSDGETRLPESNVLQYKLSDGSTVTVRPSGTEPKIKFYFSSKSGSSKETEQKIDKMIADLIPGVKGFIEARIK